MIRDAGRAGDARAHGQDLIPYVRRPGRRQRRVFGTRPHQAHLADQHVPQLRQFVQLGIPQPFADGGDARVIRRRDARPGITGRLLAHGAELEDLEDPPTHSQARPAEEDRARGIAFDQQGDDDEEGRQQQQAQCGGQDVHQPLGGIGIPVGPQGDPFAKG